MVFFNDPLPSSTMSSRPPGSRSRSRRSSPSWQTVAEARNRARARHRSRGRIRDSGRIGFEGRYDYGVLGPVTNLANRLSTSAGGRQILIGPRVFAAVDDAVVTARSASSSSRASAARSAAYEVRGLRRQRRRLGGARRLRRRPAGLPHRADARSEPGPAGVRHCETTSSATPPSAPSRPAARPAALRRARSRRSAPGSRPPPPRSGRQPAASGRAPRRRRPRSPDRRKHVVERAVLGEEHLQHRLRFVPLSRPLGDASPGRKRFPARGSDRVHRAAPPAGRLRPAAASPASTSRFGSA